MKKGKLFLQEARKARLFAEALAAEAVRLEGEGRTHEADSCADEAFEFLSRAFMLREEHGALGALVRLGAEAEVSADEAREADARASLISEPEITWAVRPVSSTALESTVFAKGTRRVR